MLLSIGCSFKSVPLMVIGRIIYSIGGENLNTCQFALIIEWFKKNELGFALGISLSCSRFGSLLNDFASSYFANSSDVSTALWIGFAISNFSYLAIILLVYLDWRQEILIQMKEIVNSNAVVLNQEERPIKTIYKLPRVFYLMAILCAIVYGGVLPFNYLASNFMVKTLYFNSPTKTVENATFTLILQFISSTVFIPFIGLFVDKIGQRSNLLILASTLGIATYSLFILTYPTLPLILLGFTYSLFATVIWPSFALIVPNDIIGIAYGMTSSLQNIGIVFFPLIVESLFIWTKKYEITLLFFFFLMINGLILSIYIKIEDYSNSGILDSDLSTISNECNCNCFKSDSGWNHDKIKGKYDFNKKEECQKLLV